MPKSSSIRSLVLSLMLALLSSGCAFNKPEGSVYSTPSAPSSGMAQLVVYRPLGEGAGYDRVYDLEVDGTQRVDMLHGGYSVLEVEPGTHELGADKQFTIRAWLPCILLITIPFIVYAECIADTDAQAQVDLASGQTAFVSFDPAERELRERSSSEAAAELSECRAQD